MATEVDKRGKERGESEDEGPDRAQGPSLPRSVPRHFPSVQTAFGDLENDLRSGAGTEVPWSPDGRYPPTVHHIFPWWMMNGEDWHGGSSQGQAAQSRKGTKTGTGLGRREPPSRVRRPRVAGVEAR